MVVFQSFTDLSTVENRITLVTVYAGGNHIVYRAMPQFTAFKYYRLGPVTIKLIPASTLPIDPTGLSYEAGDKTVDPRDQLTPGLVRITNGEDFYTNLPNENIEAQRGVYEAMMLDERWFKWSLQTGITKTATPYYWMIGQVRQDYYPGAVNNMPAVSNVSGTLSEVETTNSVATYYENNPDNALKFNTRHQYSSGRGIFQTGQHGTLGWMPTDALIAVGNTTELSSLTPSVNAVPQVELFRIVMPPAYKTRYYYRMYITEEVYFKDPVITNPECYRDNEIYRYTPADRFIRMDGIVGRKPTESYTPNIPGPIVPNDAANTSKGYTNASDNTAGK